LSVSQVFIYLGEDKYFKGDRNTLPEGRIELVYNPVPERLVKRLKNKGQAATAAAQIIYDSYVEAHEKFEALLYSVGQVRNLFPSPPCSLQEFYDRALSSRHAVEWQADGGSFQPFTPKVLKPRGRNPLFKTDQLITLSRWVLLQNAADAGAFPEGEVLELYRIRAKAAWREIGIAVLEASIISERLLRAYALEILRGNGFSNSKIKRLKDELTFDNLLNILLPLSLSKTEFRRIQSHIGLVDNLRVVRNHLMHGKIQEKDVDRKVVDKGIDSAIRLVRFLHEKLRHTPMTTS
jgi:hypothetical protein